MLKPKVIVILGATATGKSYCGLELAKKLHTEIISGDSMLVYRRMNIGTAKPNVEELQAVPHHLVDILEPDDEFNVFDFKKRIAVIINDCNVRGKIPIIVGGTGLYIKAVLEDYQFNTVDCNEAFRLELEKIANSDGNFALMERLRILDPIAAARLHLNDRRRIIRAIETATLGETVSQNKKEELAYDAVVFGLSMERETLYNRINIRVDQMVEQGLFEEVHNLLQEGVSQNAQSMKSIGYKQVVQYYSGELDRTTAIAKIKQYTRNFAKRQFTWYKKMSYIKWFEVKSASDYDDISEQMKQILEQKFNLR